MSYEFSADEIFEMAEQIEINGEKFYRAAAEAVEEKDKKELLTHLADMETGHIKAFQTLRKGLSEKEQESITFDPQDENILYLKAFADSHIFFKKELDVSSLEKIYRAGIQAEKDSIVFYLGLKQIVSDSHGKDKLESIIKEEMEHLRLLNTKLTELKA